MKGVLRFLVGRETFIAIDFSACFSILVVYDSANLYKAQVQTLLITKGKNHGFNSKRKFREYTMSLNENSALHKDLKSWRGKSFTEQELKAFDLTKILGVSCDLEVEHTSGGRAKVTSVFKPDGGAQKSPTANDPVVFDLEDYCKEFSDESNDASKEMCDVFAGLPNFLCDKIDQSYEIAAAHAKSRKAEAPKGLAAMAKMQQEAQEAQPAKDQPAAEFHDDEIPF